MYAFLTQQDKKVSIIKSKKYFVIFVVIELKLD